ncbi:MAG: FHA domain-containing protein [Lentimicrobium sp.]
MDETLFLGRASDNHLVIKSEKVSGRHCSVKKISDTEFLVSDLGSSNGTFINGRRIMQSTLRETDEICLASYPVDSKMVLNLLVSGSFKKGVIYEDFKKQELIFVEFAKLQAVYELYHKEKRRIMKNNNLKNTGLRAGLSMIPVVGSALGILSTAVTGNVQDELLEHEENFKKTYICPGCFRFLGAEPFENMERRGYCLICKTKWKR